jgi:hypothetical protein
MQQASATMKATALGGSVGVSEPGGQLIGFPAAST